MKEQKEQPVQLIIQNCQPVEDEIDLRELWLNIKKNKKVIFATTIFFFILALIYVYVKTPIYMIEANIEPGYIKSDIGTKSHTIKIQDAQNLRINLITQYGEKAKDNELPYLEASVDRKAKQIVNVKVYANSNESAKKYLNKALKKIREEDKEFIHTYKTNILKKIELNKKIIQNLKHEISTLKLQLKHVDTQTLQTIYNQIGALQSKIISLQQQNLDLEAKLSPTFIHPTKIIGQILVNNKPTKPKKTLILAIALISGLIVGIFLVFFLEFLKNVNEEEK